MGEVLGFTGKHCDITLSHEIEDCLLMGLKEGACCLLLDLPDKHVILRKYIAARLGVTTAAVWLWEDKGLLPPSRRVGRNSCYSIRDVCAIACVYWGYDTICWAVEGRYNTAARNVDNRRLAYWIGRLAGRAAREGLPETTIFLLRKVVNRGLFNHVSA